MKNFILYLSVCSLVLLLSNCTDKDSKVIIEIPDTNFKTYLLENFDKNQDGEISLSEAKAVKEINCSNKGIEVLDGIEKFVNLESLDCSNNQIGELWLTHNKKLNRLSCAGNNAIFIYIGMTSPLRNQNVQKPTDNSPSQAANMTSKLLDDSKCTYDHDMTSISLSFDD